MSELGEQEKEETIRLKKVMENESKVKSQKEVELICNCCLSMYETENQNDPETDSLCPVCAEGLDSSQSLEMDICCNVEHEEKETDENEEKKRLEQLMTHINEVMFDLANQPENMVSRSTEKFYETCSKFKGKIENFANAQLQLSLCDLCKQNEKSDTTLGKKLSRSGSTKSVTLPPERTQSFQNGKELGHFEIKTEEIVKITKFQNEDGTIGEEKQVIKIKTERKTPPVPNSAAVKAKTGNRISYTPKPTESITNLESEISNKTSTIILPPEQQQSLLTGENKGTRSVDKVSSLKFEDIHQKPGDSVSKNAFTSTTDLGTVPSQTQSRKPSPSNICPSCKAKMSSSRPDSQEPSICTIKIIAKPEPSIVICPHQEPPKTSKSSDCITCNYSSKSISRSGSNGTVCKSCRDGSTKKSVSESSACTKCCSGQEKPRPCPKCGKEKKQIKHICPISSLSKSQSLKSTKEEPSLCPECDQPVKKSLHKCPSCGKPKKPKSCPVCTTKPRRSVSQESSCPKCKKSQNSKLTCPLCGKEEQPISKPSCPVCSASKSQRSFSPNSCPLCSKPKSACTDCDEKKLKSNTGCPDCDQDGTGCPDCDQDGTEKKGGGPECYQMKVILKPNCPVCASTKSQNSISLKPSCPTCPTLRQDTKPSCPSCAQSEKLLAESSKPSSCKVCSVKSAPSIGCPSCAALKQQTSQKLGGAETLNKESCPFCDIKPQEPTNDENDDKKGKKKKDSKEVKHSCKYCDQNKDKKGKDKAPCPICKSVESRKSLTSSASKCGNCPTCGITKSAHIENNSEPDKGTECPMCGKKKKVADPVPDDKSKKKGSGKDINKKSQHACKYCGETKDKKGKEKQNCPICSAAEAKRALDCNYCDEKSGPPAKPSEGSCSVCGKPEKPKLECEPCEERTHKEQDSKSGCPSCDNPKEPKKCQTCQERENAEQANNIKESGCCSACGAKHKPAADSNKEIESPCPTCNKKGGKKAKSTCNICEGNAKEIEPKCVCPECGKPNLTSETTPQPTCPSCGANTSVKTDPSKADPSKTEERVESPCPSCKKGAKPKSQCNLCSQNVENDKKYSELKCPCAEPKPSCPSCGISKPPQSTVNFAVSTESISKSSCPSCQKRSDKPKSQCQLCQENADNDKKPKCICQEAQEQKPICSCQGPKCTCQEGKNTEFSRNKPKQETELCPSCGGTKPTPASNSNSLCNCQKSNSNEPKCSCSKPKSESNSLCKHCQDESSKNEQKCSCSKPQSETSSYCKHCQDEQSKIEPKCSCSKPKSESNSLCKHCQDESSKNELKCSCSKPQSETSSYCKHCQDEQSKNKPKCSCKETKAPSTSSSLCTQCNEESNNNDPKCSCGESKPSSKSSSNCKHCMEESEKEQKCSCKLKSPSISSSKGKLNAGESRKSKSKCSCTESKSSSKSSSVCKHCKKKSESKSKCSCTGEKSSSESEEESEEENEEESEEESEIESKCPCKAKKSVPSDFSTGCKKCKEKGSNKTNEKKCPNSVENKPKPVLKKLSISYIIGDKKDTKSGNGNEKSCPICKKKSAQKRASSCSICSAKTKEKPSTGKSRSYGKIPQATKSRVDFDLVNSRQHSSSDSSCCSVSNKSFGIETEACVETCSYKSITSDKDDDDEMCCSTQTQKKSSPKSCCISTQKSKDRTCCIAEVKTPSNCGICNKEKKDAAVNTKFADRYDVRTVQMIPGASSKPSCCCKVEPSAVCNCKSEPNCTPTRKPVSTSRSKSFDEKDYHGKFYF